MEHPAIRILNANRIMSISTVRPDGWPQTTIVGYANRGFELLFMIYRSGQKFANILQDNRISIAVGAEPSELDQLQAVYAGAHAEEITDSSERTEAWRQLMQRHSNLAGFSIPAESDAAFMKARCTFVSLLDFTQGKGHREQLLLDDQGIPVEKELLKDEWGKDVQQTQVT